MIVVLFLCICFLMLVFGILVVLGLLYLCGNVINKSKMLLVVGISISLLFLLVSLLNPFFITKFSSYFPKISAWGNDYGAALNGLMTPFVTVSASVLTFLAFLTQYQANTELKKSNDKQQVERQFYEMLRIHKDNVEKLEWTFLGSKEGVDYEFDCKNNQACKIANGTMSSTSWTNQTIYGQKAIAMFLQEFNFIYDYLKIYIYNDRNKLFSKSYEIFFDGILACDLDKSVKDRFIQLRDDMNNPLCKKLSVKCSRSDLDKYNDLMGAKICGGHGAVLNSYYRHLFLMVRTIAESEYDSSQRKCFLKILRAQLTSKEQMLLLYNWKSLYGKEWESEKGNRYFSEYMMIHNIELQDCVFSENELYELFPYVTQQDKSNLFEFEQRKHKLV